MAVGRFVGSCSRRRTIDVAINKRKVVINCYCAKILVFAKEQKSKLTGSSMMLGSNGSSQKADFEASDEHRQHLRESTGNNQKKKFH